MNVKEMSMWTKMMPALLLVVGSWMFLSPHADAACVVRSTSSYAEGTPLRDDECDTAGNKKVTLGGAAAGGLGTNEVADPSRVEGSPGSFSFDLLGGARVNIRNIGVLLSGEDQTNNLFMTSGGKVRQIVWPVVSTNTTSTVQVMYTGYKSLKGTLVCNAGASTNCGITVEVFGNENNSTTGGESLCTVTIPTGLATTTGTCVISAPYSYVYFKTTGVAGTSPVLTMTGME